MSKINRLSKTASPYLLQHSTNPVDWYPWGEEAFEKARSENKLIFLSIGYFTCHWCHVMEKESFESDTVAAVLNRDFVSVKVDREEMPDIDQIYMSVLTQVFQQGGGWPLSMWLTPDLKPVYGGTYFPPETRWGRPSFIQVLEKLADDWKKNPEELQKLSEKVTTVTKKIDLEMYLKPGTAPPETTKSLFSKAVQKYSARMDSVHGGFAGAPKFPQTPTILFLLRSGEKARPLADLQLQKMADGGIFDHLEGGFSRYSVDETWTVPHFEKMLYDNALLLQAYSEANVEGSAYTETIKKTFSYMSKRLLSPEGGFYCGEDADSEGEEGKFYVWEYEELKNILGTDFEKLATHFDIQPDGNFEFKIVLQKNTAGDPGAGVLEKLERVRDQRIRPARDEKILCAWNGLTISGLVAAAAVVPKALGSAKNCANFILQHLYRDEMLFRSYFQGRVGGRAVLEDYAFFIQGLLDLYQATADTQWFATAHTLQKKCNELFWNEKLSLFSSYSQSQPDLIATPDQLEDGALPNAGAIALKNRLRLALILNNELDKTLLKKVFEKLHGTLQLYPTRFPSLLSSLPYLDGEYLEVQSDRQDFLEKLREKFIPYFVLKPLGAGQKISQICYQGTCHRIENLKDLSETLDRYFLAR